MAGPPPGPPPKPSPDLVRWPYSYEAPVNATEEMAWSVFIDKIKAPGRHMPGVKKCEILGEGCDWVERRLVAFDHVNHQKISINDSEKLVTYEWINHPEIQGNIYNKVKKEGDKVYIEIWADHKGKRGVPEDVQKAELNYFDFKMACMGSKKKIEALTAAGQKNVWE